MAPVQRGGGGRARLGRHRRAGARPWRGPRRARRQVPSPATRRAATWSARVACRYWRSWGVRVSYAGQGSDLLAVGPSGRARKLLAFPGRSYAGHGLVVPRLVFDNALREAAVAAGAVPVQARITAVDADGDGIVRAVIASDGLRLAADVVIGADGALSPLARLAGMLDPDTALWGFPTRAYLPAREVPLPLLVLLDARPWRIYPGYGWLFPGADGQANAGIGVGLGTTRLQAPLRGATGAGSAPCWPSAATSGTASRRGRSPAAGCG